VDARFAQYIELNPQLGHTAKCRRSKWTMTLRRSTRLEQLSAFTRPHGPVGQGFGASDTKAQPDPFAEDQSATRRQYRTFFMSNAPPTATLQCGAGSNPVPSIVIRGVWLRSRPLQLHRGQPFENSVKTACRVPSATIAGHPASPAIPQAVPRAPVSEPLCVPVLGNRPAPLTPARLWTPWWMPSTALPSRIGTCALCAC